MRVDSTSAPVFTTPTLPMPFLSAFVSIPQDKTSGVKAHPAPDDNCTLYPRHLIGSITGPEGTAYEGGVFEVDILISKEYPFEPPKMKFTTKIWHPNVSSQTGAICLVSWTTWCFIPSAQRRLLRD